MVIGITSCNSKINGNNTPTSPIEEELILQDNRNKQLLVDANNNDPIPAAYLLGDWIEKLKGKRVAIVGNQTSVVKTQDTI
ncbi:MAG: DUF1343 domain-containing protein, partial [Nonlabens sp.]